MTTIAYASAHIDGVLDCRSLKVGILETPQPTPVVFFQVIAGAQRHPVWAIERTAAFVYCYCQVAKKYKQAEIEVNTIGNLVSGEKTCCVIASKILWHTSTRIRIDAENQISAMTSNSHGHLWSEERWPSRETLSIPISQP